MTVLPLFVLRISTTVCLKQLCEQNVIVRSSNPAHLHAKPEATSNVRLVSNIISDISNLFYLAHNIFKHLSIFVSPPYYTKSGCSHLMNDVLYAA